MNTQLRTVLRGTVRIPTSKPHTQRALLMATLADGRSVIRRPNVCSESVLLREACSALGADFADEGDTLVVHGVAGRPRRPSSVMQVRGSGFALRHLLPVAALAEAPCVVTGDRKLAGRPVRPLLTALNALGGRIESADAELVLPVITWSTGFSGGRTVVPAGETSQFVSAVMLAAPYAKRPVEIEVPGPVVGQHYIRMTRDMMTRYGADVSTRADLSTITVRPGGYQARDLTVGPDVTALFYFVAAAVITDADILVEDVALGVDEFLDSAITLGRRLGVRLTQEGSALRIRSGPAPAGPVDIDAADVPTLVPALAAAASSLPNGVRLRNAGHIRHHKTSRLQVVLDELARLGRILRPLYRDGALDGFETETVVPAAPDQLDSHGDHRNFMALYLATLATGPVPVLGAETLVTSFADFQEVFHSLSH